MGIDRFYELMGTAFKRVFHRTVKRPVSNINIDNRAQKAVEIQKSAPWHETTQKIIDDLRQSRGPELEQLKEKNTNLAEHLRQVKVVSFEHNPDAKTDAKLPTKRIGADLPYVFYQTKERPVGKISAVDMLNIVSDHKNTSASIDKLSQQYRIAPQDVENILKHLDLFSHLQSQQPETEERS